MMVERTKVALKDIKLEKNYHTNFITPGWNLEPGTYPSKQALRSERK